MKAQIGRLWRLARGRGDEGASRWDGRAGAANGPNGWASRDPGRPLDEHAAATDVAGTDPATSRAALPPEQPVLLLPSGTRAVRVGEVLPPQRRSWPLSVVRLPAVPKRAILAAGLVAGLAGPGLAKHLATRMLLGGTAAKADGILEITRIVYTGPLTPRATAAIAKAILATRR